jgi:polyhydroxybutyrate depolymerase
MRKLLNRKSGQQSAIQAINGSDSNSKMKHSPNTIKMKLKFFLLLFLLAGITKKNHAQYDSIMHSSGYRTYLLHLPPSYVPGDPAPMLIAMHGGFGSGPQLENQSQLSVKADSEGFIVVYPEGVRGNLNIRTWNAGGCCGYAMNNNIDDVGFISALIDTLKDKYSIDTNRVYATGMSNGGFMSYRLACEIPEKIVAIAPVAASMNVISCNPPRPVPVIHFHSYLDQNVPYQGGTGSGTSNHHNPPLDSVMNVWSFINTCHTVYDTLTNDSNLTHIRFGNCTCGSEIHLYLTKDGGHSWPGGNSTGIGDPASMVISANDLMWDFFQQYSLQCGPTGMKETGNNAIKLKVTPNPPDRNITIQTEGALHHADMILYHSTGRIVHRIENVSGHRLEIKRGNLPAGLYFVQVYESGKIMGATRIILTN